MLPPILVVREVDALSKLYKRLDMSKRRKKRIHAAEQKQNIERSSRKVLEGRSTNQNLYIDSIVHSDITFCSGPAGSGKTTIAVGVACEYLLDDEIDKIIITRPIVESGRSLGFLPGNLISKISPYLIPVIEEMKLYLGANTLESMRAQGRIELCPLEYMRGRNFHDSFMILDEAQNATFEQIKMFLTRIGMGSKAIVNGDIEQTDLPKHEKGGLNLCMHNLADIDKISICNLEGGDIVRNNIIVKILDKLKNVKI